MNDNELQPRPKPIYPADDEPAWFGVFAAIFGVLVTFFTGILFHPAFIVLCVIIYLIAFAQRAHREKSKRNAR